MNNAKKIACQDYKVSETLHVIEYTSKGKAHSLLTLWKNKH